MAQRRRFSDGSTSSKSATPRGNRYGGDSREPEIPFVDAHPDSDEIPLDQLDTFIIPARDEKGATEPRTIHIPPYMLRQIEILIRSGRFPYLRFSDLARHALYRHVRWLTSIRHSIPKHILVALEATAEVCRQSEQQERVDEIIHTLKRRIQHLCDRGQHGEVRRILNLVKVEMSSVKEGHAADQVKDILETQFYAPFLSVHSPATTATAKEKATK